MAGEVTRSRVDARHAHTSSPPTFHLSGEDVHIWHARLDQPEASLGYYFSLLSDDEISRSARFIFEKDRRHYIVGRAILRQLIAGYLDERPAKIQFNYSPLGKPFVKTGSRDAELQFNLAHSNDRAVYMFGLGRRIGIDLEQIHIMPGMDRFADFYYSLRECVFINSLEGQQKTRAFFKVWTCKEAVFKAIGAGLTKEINQTEVSFDTTTGPELVCIDGDSRLAIGWHLELFTPFGGYQAALAVESQPGKVIFRQAEDLPGPS